MRILAVTQRLQRSNHAEVRECLDERWGVFLRQAGFLPVALSIHCDFLEYTQRFNFAGVLLTGGNDIAAVSDDELAKKRDAFEELVVRWAVDRRLPIVGVCRGMQFLTHFFGGKLTGLPNHVGNRHPLTVIDGTVYADKLRKLSDVNSYHNYGILELPPPLTPVARCADGSVEALTHRTLPIFAQMWHPEREREPSPADLEVLQSHFAMR